MASKASSGSAQTVRLRLLGAAGILIIMAGWAIASLVAGSFFVPAPWTTIADTALLLARGFTWTQILITVLRVCVGFLSGFLAGLVAGIAMGARRELDALFKPLVVFFQGMPPLLWAIPLVALMGIGHVPTIVVIGLITFPLVAVTIREGMSTLPRELGEMLSIFAPGFIPRARELILPHLAPFLGASLKAGLVLAVKASVTAEYFGANDGIGFQIQAAYMTLRIRSLFSWAFVLILVILAVNRLLPRIRFTRSEAAKSGRRRAPSCSGDDTRELREIFTSRTGAPRISLDGVSFSYRRGGRILENATLEVSAREIAVITGESGVGKTTILKLVASLLKPVEGSIACPSRVGFVFQDDRLLPWRSVVENAAMPLVYQGYPKKNALCFAQYLLSEAGLAGEEEKRPDELSGGMKKRAALARCFARLPDAILLDEPFSGLHAEARALLWTMFLRLRALHPVPTLIVTHYPQEISSLALCRHYRLEGKPARIVAAS
jgi:ABC-type nitrate/sulfonate/bicarbonate transport system ATPase subunit/ABC-type nitrate/sulfonate/bicarbonate transport system permease component